MAKAFQTMPGPQCYPFLGSLLQYTVFGPYSYDQLHVAKRENFKRYGSIYREKLGPGLDVVQVFDPKTAGCVLRQEGRYPNRPPLPITLTAHRREGTTLGLGSLNGPEWYELRSCLQSLMMRPGAASVYLGLQSAVADDFLDLIAESLTDEGYVTDLYRMLLKYTMESIGVVCYNTRLGCLDQSLDQHSVGYRMFRATTDLFDAVQRTMFAFPWYSVFRTPLYKQFVEANKECDRLAMSFIDNMRLNPDEDQTAGEARPNFLSSLMALGKLDKQRAVAVTNELFVAGIDSTANALSFVFYNLARSPAKQQLLAAEIDDVIKACRPTRRNSSASSTSLKQSDDVTQSMIDKMHLLKACVKESFRLNYPIEGGPIRVLDKDMVLGGYSVPKKTVIVINNQTMCMQSEHFDQPEAYIPERWLKTGSATLRPPPPYVMLPFGYGPRMCIGRRFAEQEIYLAVIKILSRFRLAYEGEEIGMINRVFTVPDKPLKIKFIRK